MRNENGSLSTGDRLYRMDAKMGDLEMRVRKLELSWAKATGIIIAAQFLIGLAMKILLK